MISCPSQDPELPPRVEDTRVNLNHHPDGLPPTPHTRHNRHPNEIIAKTNTLGIANIHLKHKGSIETITIAIPANPPPLPHITITTIIILSNTLNNRKNIPLRPLRPGLSNSPYSRNNRMRPGINRTVFHLLNPKSMPILGHHQNRFNRYIPSLLGPQRHQAI